MNYTAIRQRHSASYPPYGVYPQQPPALEVYSPENYLDNRCYPYVYPPCSSIPGMPQQMMPNLAVGMPNGMPYQIETPSDAHGMSSWDPAHSYSTKAFQVLPSRQQFPKVSSPGLREVPINDANDESHLYGPGPPIITGARVRGPRGANLFCFHLPNEMTNWDLYLLFRRFGTILSVHTMINKQTGLSRGFGFVSFQEPSAADEAIEKGQSPGRGEGDRPPLPPAVATPAKQKPSASGTATTAATTTVPEECVAQETPIAVAVADTKDVLVQCPAPAKTVSPETGAAAVAVAVTVSPPAHCNCERPASA